MGVALREILAEYRTPVGYESLAGAAVFDGNNALYQFLTIIRQPDGTPLMDRRGRITSHLSGLLFRTATFLEKGIRPIFVFDGKPADLKQATVEARQKVRSDARERWKEAVERGDEEEAYRQARSSASITAEILTTARDLLHLLGIPVVQAPGEGEAQAAHMAANGDARYVVSQDYDTLLFGAPVLVRNLTVSGKRKIRGRTISVVPERIVLSDTLAGLGLTREELVQVGILVGTDFNEGVYGIGAKKGLKIVRGRAFARTLGEKLPGFVPEPVMDLFLHPPVTDSYELSWSSPDAEGIRKMLCDDYDFSADRVDKALEGFTVRAGQRTLESWL